MARIAEPEKMENIKKAVMEIIIDHGYDGMSIASISKKALVSPGYLYRYYKSKEELVEELVDSELEEILNGFISDIDSSSTIYEVAYNTIERLFLNANKNPLSARFTASVVMDIKIPSKNKKDNFKAILELAEKCIELRTKTCKINLNITPIEVLSVSFTIPFRYLLLSFELDKNKHFTTKEIKRVADMCIQALN